MAHFLTWFAEYFSLSFFLIEEGLHLETHFQPSKRVSQKAQLMHQSEPYLILQSNNVYFVPYSFVVNLSPYYAKKNNNKAIKYLPSVKISRVSNIVFAHRRTRRYEYEVYISNIFAHIKLKCTITKR